MADKMMRLDAVTVEKADESARLCGGSIKAFIRYAVDKASPKFKPSTPKRQIDEWAAGVKREMATEGAGK